MQFVVQYLTQAAIKLPSAGDNTRSSVQHPLQFVRYCPWCTGQDGVTVIHSRVNEGMDEHGQRVRVQRPPDTPELTKSVKAASADARDVTIDAQIQRNVHAERGCWRRQYQHLTSAPDNCLSVLRSSDLS